MSLDEVLALAFTERHPDRAASVLERLDPTDAADAVANLPPERAAAVLSHFTTGFAAECLAKLAPERAAEILERADLDVEARLLRALPEEDRTGIVAGLSQGTRVALEGLLRFPKGTAGSVMEPRVLALPRDLGVKDAIQRLEREAQALRGYVYVVDRGGALVGVVAVRELMSAEASAQLGSIMRAAEATVSPFTAVSDLLTHPGWQDYHALPVVDENRALLGAVRYSTYRRLEREVAGGRQTSELVDTGVALAELYWLLLSRALTGVATTSAPSPDPAARLQKRAAGQLDAPESKTEGDRS